MFETSFDRLSLNFLYILVNFIPIIFMSFVVCTFFFICNTTYILYNWKNSIKD